MVEGTKKKILIAEDEKPMAMAVQAKLNKSGFEADVAFNGEEALQKISENSYDLLLLDLVMPVKDGFTVLEELKGNTQGMKILVASNLSQESDEKKAKELGAVDFVIKSNTSLVEIVEKIQNTLE